MQVKPLTEIEALLRSIAEPMGIEIVEVEFKTKGSPSLTVYIDKEGGVDLNACEAFHGAIDAPLDELDPTFGASYTLNVSSPGLDRPFEPGEVSEFDLPADASKRTVPAGLPNEEAAPSIGGTAYTVSTTKDIGKGDEGEAAAPSISVPEFTVPSYLRGAGER